MNYVEITKKYIEYVKGGMVVETEHGTMNTFSGGNVLLLFYYLFLANLAFPLPFSHLNFFRAFF